MAARTIVGPLAAALAGVAPQGVVTGCRLISGDDIALLHDLERTAVAAAADVRRREFASGRALLRELLGSASPIPVGPNRAPVVPSGSVVSLAHDRSVAVAAISSDQSIAALGIDIEPTDPFGDDEAEMVLRADEHGIDAHLAFVLKEAAYKAWSSLGGRIVEFHDVRLDVQAPDFQATFVADRRRFEGRFVESSSRRVALVVARRGSESAW